MLLTSGDIHKNVCPRGDLNSSRLGDIEVHPRSQGALSRVDSASPSLPDSRRHADIQLHGRQYHAKYHGTARHHPARTVPLTNPKSGPPGAGTSRRARDPTGLARSSKGVAPLIILLESPGRRGPGSRYVCGDEWCRLRGAGICSSMAAGLGTAQGQRSWKAKVTDSTHS